MSLEDRVQAEEKTLLCPHCEQYVTPTLTVAGPHIRADCPSCGRYIKFVRQNLPPDERARLDAFSKYVS